MIPVFDIGGTTGMLLLAAPVLLLASALMWALFWPGLVTSAPHQAPHRPPDRNKEPPPRQKEAPRQQPSPPTGAPVWRPGSSSAANGGNGTQTAPGKMPVQPPPPASFLDSELGPTPSEALDPRIAEARQNFDEAVAHRENGNDPTAADCLRKTIMLATSAGDKPLHALARLELGDICKSEGDLITACEHWQMARSLFEETSSASDAEVCEKRMLGNGCPTDWVLTDF